MPNGHDDATLKAIKDNAHGLAGISGERIWVEVKKIVTGRHVPSIMRVMFELGVARYLGFPIESDLDKFEEVCKASTGLAPLHMTLISALLKTEQQVYHLHDRVKMSNDEKELGLFIVNHRDDDFGPDPFNHCQDLVCDTTGTVSKPKQRVCELLKYLDNRVTLKRVDEWDPPKFPVKGEDVLEAGVPKGRAVGKVLSYLQQKWKDSRYTSGAKELLVFVDEAKKSVL